GEFDVPDPKLAALLVLDALNALSRWLHPDRGHSPPDVIAAYTELVVERASRARSSCRLVASAAGAPAVSDRMRAAGTLGRVRTSRRPRCRRWNPRAGSAPRRGR